MQIVLSGDVLNEDARDLAKGASVRFLIFERLFNFTTISEPGKG